jgi:hypothetical protein
LRVCGHCHVYLGVQPSPTIPPLPLLDVSNSVIYASAPTLCQVMEVNQG